jgi:hypothetical protein
MKKVLRFNPMFLFPVLVILSSTWGVQRAQAATVDMFTGSWSPYLPFQIGSGQGLDVFFQLNSYQSELTSNPVLACTNTCPPPGPPPDGSSEGWSGTFDGGSVQFQAGLDFKAGILVPVYEFDGTVTGGSFSGGWTVDSSNDEFDGWNQQTLSFKGTWFHADPVTGALSSIDWRSEGTITDSWDWYNYPPGGDTSLTFTLATYTTPEPASITLLGLGLVAVGFLRCRRATRAMFRAHWLPYVATAFMCLALLPSSANADVIFNDFGPDYTSGLNAFCVSGISSWFCSDDGRVHAPAALFKSPATYNVTQIDVSLSHNSGTNGAIISLFTETARKPGTLLGSWTVSGQPVTPGYLGTPPGPLSSLPITTVTGITGITLEGGVSYFLRISPGDASTQDFWTTNPNLRLTGEVYDFIGSTMTLPAFDVLGTPLAPAPEPSSSVILGTALVVAVVTVCRRQPARKRMRLAGVGVSDALAIISHSTRDREYALESTAENVHWNQQA